MKKLIEQVMKFVIVGGLSFVLDFIIYYVLTNFFSVYYLVAGFFSFTLSLIFNYLMSMKFVFKSKEDLKKTHEFAIFATLSVMGLGLNLLSLFILVDLFKMNDLIAKVFVAGIVMVFNFVTRKIFLEQK
ncbi:MAG: GtrA family protein [Erysipelotrichaceae bacterium]|jgi:putative flippase GtrA|nr:GtrA family protein [Erysipelotrichaceae bacterium]